MNSVVNSLAESAGAIAIAALAVSVTALLISRRRLRIEINREARQGLGLEPTLVDSFHETDDASQDRVYAFHVTVRNPSDRRNAIAEAELEITRTTSKGTTVPAILQALRAGGSASVRGGGASILIPAAIQAHDTVSGWLQFRVPRTILKGAKVESYRINLRDTEGDETKLKPIFVREYQNET